MMYRKGPGLELPRGQSVSYQPAHDEAEAAAAIASGWFPSVPEALAEKLDAPAVEKPEEPRAPAVEIPPEKPPEPPVERAPFVPEVYEEPARRGPGRPRRS
jgi:hypothetical protein